jgi:hypothetical protein
MVLPIIEASLGSVMVMLRSIEFSVEQAGKRKGRGSAEEVEGGEDGDGGEYLHNRVNPFLCDIRT